jgi:hypothetical protein
MVRRRKLRSQTWCTFLVNHVKNLACDRDDSARSRSLHNHEAALAQAP